MPSSTCDTCVDDESFDSEASYSYESLDIEKHLPYGQGECIGVISQDSVTIGDQYSSATQTFVLVKTQRDIQTATQADGVLVLPMQGLAFDTLSDDYPTLVESLVSSGYIERPTFLLHLTADYVDSSPYLELGVQSMDKSSHTVPLWNPGKYWSTSLSAVRVGPYSCDFINSRIAVFDSSKSYLGLPLSDFTSIMSVISADEYNCGYDQDMLACPCNVTAHMHDIQITLGDEVFTVAPKDFAIPLVTEGMEMCLVMIKSVDVTNEGMDAWVLGDVFFRAHDVLFDMGNEQVVIEKDPSSSSSGGLPTWAIVVIVVVAVIAVVSLITVTVCCCCRRKRPNNAPIYTPLQPQLGSPAQVYTVAAPQAYHVPAYPGNVAPSAPMLSASGSLYPSLNT